MGKISIRKIIVPLQNQKQRTISLVIGEKGAGKSFYIQNKYDELLPFCEKVNTFNPDTDYVIYVLKNKQTKEIIILNAGSDTGVIINDFGKVLNQYPEAAIVFTAIRPSETNPDLCGRMLSTVLSV